MRLYEYQEQYLSNLPKKAIMAADTGTGKTVMALAHYESHARGTPLLIVAPASKVRTGDWEREIAEWFEGRPLPEYEVISYERLGRNVTSKQWHEGKRPNFYKYSRTHGGTDWAIIADEVHFAKSYKSNRGKVLHLIAKHAPFFVGLSATPMPNGWMDFANYSKIFGFTKGITEFKKRYVIEQRFKGYPEIVGYNREFELKKQWNSISKRLLKSEALDLPDRTFRGVEFKRPSSYVRMMIDRRDSDGELLETAPALAHALRQTLTTKDKIDYLSDVIEGTDQNIVIFYNYNSERKAILEMIAKKHPEKTLFRQDGEKHELPPKEAWAGVNNSITLGHYKSASTGVEMTYATIVIFFSPTYSYAEHMQSIGRVYRNGQTQKTTFYNFRTANSIEEDVWNCLKGKQEFQATQWLNSKDDNM